MAEHEMCLEYKYRKLTAPMVRDIVGASIQNKVKGEIIIRCLSSTKDAREAAQDFSSQGIRVTIIEGDTPPK